MLKVFGKKLCSACQEKKAELDAKGVEYIYFDLDTAEGLAEAAFYGILGKNITLPFIIQDDDESQS